MQPLTVSPAQASSAAVDAATATELHEMQGAAGSVEAFEARVS